MYENSDTIELAVHTSCYCVLDLLCVNQTKMSAIQMILVIGCWGFGSPVYIFSDVFLFLVLNNLII